MTPDRNLYLLTIRGMLAASTIDGARATHNETAGAPANVAAARGLGDLSHMVYVPNEKAKKGAGEFLIMDVWSRIEGLNQFFANPTVQEQAAKIFTERDPVVWTAAQDVQRYSLPVPTGKNDRFVGLIRGTVRSREKTRSAWDAYAAASMAAARKLGQISHEIYYRLTPPGAPESLEVLGVETWFDADGMGTFYADQTHMAPLADLFTGEPDASDWKHPAGSWVEW